MLLSYEDETPLLVVNIVTHLKKFVKTNFNLLFLKKYIFYAYFIDFIHQKMYNIIKGDGLNMKNIKKLICLLVMTAIIAPSAAFAEESYKVYIPNDEISMFADTDTVLTDNEKEAAKDMIASLQNFETTFDISEYNVLSGNAQNFFQSFFSLLQNEHPEIFYLENISLGTNNQNILTFTYSMTDDEIKENQKLIDNECKKIVSTIPKDASDFEKTLIVHDYITSHYEYDTSYTIRTLYDTVKEKKCVCQGYSYLFMHIMNNYLNIECTSVPSDICRHMWNKVKIDDKWYNVDLTADDPVPNMSSFSNHQYFLLSDSELKSVSEASVKEANEGVYIEDQDIHRTWNNSQWDGTAAITSENDDYKDSVVRSASNVVVMDGKIYCFDSDNNLCTLDAENNILTPVYTDSANYIWFVYGSHDPYYTSKYSTVVAYNNKLYFNSPNKVFEFDTKTNTAKEVYEYTDEPNVSETYLYGLTVKDDELYTEYSTNIRYGADKLIKIINNPTKTYSSNITKNENGTYTISVTPNIETDDTPILYVAEYDENHILKHISPYEYTEPVSVNVDNESKSLTAFVWSKNKQPLAKTTSIDCSDASDTTTDNIIE